MENKYCRDCIYREVRYFGTQDEDYKCRNENNLLPDISLVTGVQDTRHAPEYLRLVDWSCSPEGKWHKTHAQRTAEYNAKIGIPAVKNTEPANPSLTLLTRLSKMKFDVDKL